jgi:DnaJ family protein C protein 3
LQCAQAVTESKRAFQHSNWPLAKDYLDQALRFAEAAPSLLMDRSWCWFHLGEQYDTIADTGKVLKLEADNMEALELRGRAYYIIGELETAINHYRKALHLDPEHKACKDMYRVVKSVIDNQKKADKATSSGDHKRAAEILIKLIAVDPDHRTVIPKARLDLARAYRHLKQLKEARQEAELVIKADENNAEAYKILGLLLGDLEDFEGAVQKLNKAKELSQGADREIDDELRKAEAALKQSKQKDYYKTLKVSHAAPFATLCGAPALNVTLLQLSNAYVFAQFVCVFHILTKGLRIPLLSIGGTSRHDEGDQEVVPRAGPAVAPRQAQGRGGEGEGREAVPAGGGGLRGALGRGEEG